MDNKKEYDDINGNVLAKIYNFFLESHDFNGIPLRDISRTFGIDYSYSIEIIKDLVVTDKVSIQSSTNPHIIGRQHYKTEDAIDILNQALTIEERTEDIGGIKYTIENTDYPICLYPSKTYLKENRSLIEFGNEEYTKLLALGEPQLSYKFFDIDVLERYFNDPRFNFVFQDYSGSISCKYDENDNPIVREEDQVFLKTFGVGYDDNGNRVAVVFLRYLRNLTMEHQMFWKSKECKQNCQMVMEYYQNTIEGNWTNSYSMFTGFIGELNCVYELTKIIFGKSIFNNCFSNENHPKDFTFFFIPTLKNYNEFVLLLDKMISDNINYDFFDGKIELFSYKKIDKDIVERNRKGTLQLFEEWLSSIFNVKEEVEFRKIFNRLKKIRRERQNPAHKISENEYDSKYTDLQKEMITGAYMSMYSLRTIFQQHPSAKGFEIPTWLEEGKVKIF